MRKFTFFFKSLLVAFLLLGGANSAWGREVSTSWKVQSTTPTAANTSLMDGDLITATTTFATTLAEESKSIAGVSFTHYIQIRNAAYPTVEVPTGTEQSGSTSVVIKPKFDGELTIYYMRQSTAQTENKGTYDLNDGKDVRVYKQSDASLLSGIMTIDTESNDGKYGWVTKVVTLEANTDYTISARGTTARLYGLKFTYDDGLVEETYDFTSVSVSETKSTNNGDVNVDGSNGLGILYNTAFDMCARFAGGKRSGNVEGWVILSSNGGLREKSGNANKDFAVLNLKKGDFITINYAGTGGMRFSGEHNITGSASGTLVVSGKEYEILSDGDLLLQCRRDGSSYITISSIIIATSTPVLSTPTVSFNSMVESGGLYYPKYTFSSEDGVTFKNGSDETITSPYTFTSAGTLTVYAVKDGRTKSAKTTYTVDATRVGMILANSVTASSLDGNPNYNGGSVAYGGDLAGTWAVPGINFESTKWYYYTSNVQPASGNRTLSCSVLNTNRIATVKRNGNYDYLTSTSNSVSYARYDQFQQYDLYVLPSEEVSVTIGSTGYSTFSSPVPLNFVGIEGLTAYVATEVEGGNVTLTSVETAPANTGLVLKGTADKEYNIPVTNAAVAPASNLLVGCIVATVVAKDATSGFNNYVLAIEGGVAKFQSLVDNGATIPAGKAFLKNGAVGGDVKALGVIFAGETATGVEAPVAAEAAVEDGIYYNLNGQQVTKDYKGIVIVNGKKFLNK